MQWEGLWRTFSEVLDFYAKAAPLTAVDANNAQTKTEEKCV